MSEEIEPIVAQLEAVWSDHQLHPDHVYLSTRQVLWLARQHLSKRAFRRWRGKLREDLQKAYEHV